MLTPYGQSFVNSVSSLRPGTAAGEDSSRNVLWMALWHGLQGQNWQRNHRARPGAARLGWTAGQVNVGWWVIRGLEGSGIATAVHRPRDLQSGLQGPAEQQSQNVTPERSSPMAHNIDHSPQGGDATLPGTDDRRSTITEQLGELEEGVRASAAGATAAAGEVVENVHDLVGTTVNSVRQSLAGASAAADEIAETVGEAVGDAVASVQRAVDLRSQVARHPWLLMGGALLIGYWLGSRSSGRPAAFTTRAPRSAPDAYLRLRRDKGGNVKDHHE